MQPYILLGAKITLLELAQTCTSHECSLSQTVELDLPGRFTCKVCLCWMLMTTDAATEIFICSKPDSVYLNESAKCRTER